MALAQRIRRAIPRVRRGFSKEKRLTALKANPWNGNCIGCKTTNLHTEWVVRQ